tara:strand:- start:40 stop:285 length:246 start_codon:yes stop_codon:yes gene_type:complete
MTDMNKIERETITQSWELAEKLEQHYPQQCFNKYQIDGVGEVECYVAPRKVRGGTWHTETTWKLNDKRISRSNLGKVLTGA